MISLSLNQEPWTLTYKNVLPIHIESRDRLKTLKNKKLQDLLERVMLVSAVAFYFLILTGVISFKYLPVFLVMPFLIHIKDMLRAPINDPFKALKPSNELFPPSLIKPIAASLDDIGQAELLSLMSVEEAIIAREVLGDQIPLPASKLDYCSENMKMQIAHINPFAKRVLKIALPQTEDQEIYGHIDGYTNDQLYARFSTNREGFPLLKQYLIKHLLSIPLETENWESAWTRATALGCQDRLKKNILEIIARIDSSSSCFKELCLTLEGEDILNIIKHNEHLMKDLYVYGNSRTKNLILDDLRFRDPIKVLEMWPYLDMTDEVRKVLFTSKKF